MAGEAMENSTTMTRRSFSIGVGAVAVGTTLPAIGMSVTSRPTISSFTVSALDPKIAAMTRHMQKMVRIFEYIDTHYFIDERCWWRWVSHFYPIVDQADEIYKWIERADTPEERAVVDWLEQIVPSQAAQARTPWLHLEGLSRRYEWLQIMFEEALIRMAEVRIAMAWITRNGRRNPCYPEHGAIVDAYHVADDGVTLAAQRIRCAERPQTRGDLLLLRRAWECRLYSPRCFEIKYLPNVQQRHRTAGISAERIPAAPTSPDRAFRYVVPAVDDSDRWEIRNAKQSALRINEPVHLDPL